MTASFENGLTKLEYGMVSIALAGMLAMSLPSQTIAADATANKTLVFKINNIQNVQISNSEKIAKLTYVNQSQQVATVVTEVKPAIAVAKSTSNTLPPKVTIKVYMHEPEIRAYVCPKLGDKCNIFIAILKAENGTHECTRDNRGLNRNGSVDIGLTQINWTPSSPYSFEQLRDCKFNLDIALQKYATRGFQPWAAYNSGRYLRHMPAVLASAQTLEAQAATPVTN